MVLTSRKGFVDNMNFKRGIFCGLLVMIGSISGITGHSIEYENIGWIYLLTLVMGMIQLVVSINYQKTYKIRVLILCFGLEGIYYVVSVINLLINSIILEVKVLGAIAGVGILVIILTSMRSLYGKRNIEKD